MKKRAVIGNAAGGIALLVALFKFVVPQNVWDVIEATRLVREGALRPADIFQWTLIAAGLVLVVLANWDWIKEEVVEKLLNPTIPLHEAALRARKRLRGTHWQQVAEGWTDNFDDAQSWFATYIAMSGPILVKRPQALDFEPMPKSALNIGQITDGGGKLVTHGGNLVYSELAIRARDLRAAIMSMRKDNNPTVGQNIAPYKGPE